MTNYIFITNEENWQIIKRENIMGLSGRWGKVFFPNIEINDKCIIYITKRSAFSGIFEIISKNPKKKIKWKSGNYNFLFDLKPITLPEKFIPIKEHIEKLKFIKNKVYWSVYFQFPKVIPDQDLKYILKLMKKP